jgi:hypothetical protein
MLVGIWLLEFGQHGDENTEQTVHPRRNTVFCSAIFAVASYLLLANFFRLL